MTIRSMERYMASLWDWALVDECFSGKVSPTDIDGHVELRGHLLWFEAKSPGATIPKAQQISMETRAMRGDTCIVIWGQPGSVTALMIMRGGVQVGPYRATNEGLVAACKWWSQCASSGRFDWPREKVSPDSAPWCIGKSGGRPGGGSNGSG